MKTVLIFAHECAPYNRPESTIGAQRPAQFAKYLPLFGWRAIVICRDANLDRSLERPDLIKIREVVRERISQADPYESLVIPIPSLKSDGVLDTLWHWYNHEKYRKSRLSIIFRKILTVLKFFTGDYSQSWQPCARQAAEEVVKHTMVDCCIGENSPDSGIFLARWFNRKYGRPWIVDSRDPILMQHHAAARIIRKYLLRWQLHKAKLLISVTPVWADLDNKDFLRPSKCITNGFDASEFLETGRNYKEKINIVYAGHVNGGKIDPFRGLRIFFKGLALSREHVGKKLQNKIVFNYYGSGYEFIKTMAKKYDVQDLVIANLPIERAQVLRKIQSADVLLLFSVGNAKKEDMYYRKGFYPGKVFEYFGARKPILCIPGDDGQLDLLIKETRTGVSIDSPEKIAELLTHIFSRRKIAATLNYNTKQNLVKEFTRERLTAHLAGALNDVAS